MGCLNLLSKCLWFLNNYYFKFIYLKLDEQRVLVEPSCGVSVQVAYDLEKYLKDNYSNVIVVVCGV